ncbi:fibronectin type III domain-containing protein [Paenibacillus sp. FSL K6-1330]|uniref:fibronectin type III domain-containing protein n=1 Tax=Paenibacillus sp. FSL K6-1330 TaxID=2975292 RepID=UPI0030DC7D11
MRVRLSVIIIALMLVLISLPLNNQAEAYPGGLLEGKQMAASSNGLNVDWSNTVSEATDGDTNTSIPLKYDGVGVAYLQYRFEKPTDITGYQLLLDTKSSKTRLRFFGENNKLLYDNANLVQDGTRTNLKISGAYEVWINANPGPINLKEFDLFGDSPQQPNPESPLNLTVIGQTSSSVDLTWNAVNSPNVQGYYVYLDGVQMPGIVTTNNFTITGLTPGQTYTAYVTAAYSNNIESGPSNTVTITLEEPVPGNSILKIYLNTGYEREYDLSTSQISDFINWYDNRANGIGKNYYPFVKTVNVGSFKKITQYITFDKIVTFDVNEY